MTDGKRKTLSAEFADDVDEDPRIHVAQLVHRTRVEARLAQEELARRAETSQAVISAIEHAVQAPGGVMLERIAPALGGHLRIELSTDSR